MKVHIGMNRFGRALSAAVAIALIISLCIARDALAKRATEEEMDRATKTLDEYFTDVQVNYRAIDGLVLKRGKADAEEIVARLNEHRLAAKSPVEKAICGYLLARAYYWRGFHQFKATRDPEVFASLRPKVFAEFLAAFRIANSSEDAVIAIHPIRSDIIGAFAAALATNLWGAKLSPEQKNRAVVEFLDIVEKMPEREKLLPAGKSLKRLYTNLGIEDRLTKQIPAKLPKDYEKLIALYDKTRGAVTPEQLMPILDAFERDHKVKLAGSTDRCLLLAADYEAAGHFEKAFGLLSRAAAKNSKYYFHLYDRSFREELNISAAEREDYLARFIAGGTTAPTLDDTARRTAYTRAAAYSRAIRGLNHAGRHQECLDLIARYHEDQSFQRGVKAPVDILLTKARCLDKTGDTRAALAVYRAFLEKAKGFSRNYVRSRERVQRRIKELSSPTQE